jgi:hypothetical protein
VAQRHSVPGPVLPRWTRDPEIRIERPNLAASRRSEAIRRRASSLTATLASTSAPSTSAASANSVPGCRFGASNAVAPLWASAKSATANA